MSSKNSWKYFQYDLVNEIIFIGKIERLYFKNAFQYSDEICLILLHLKNLSI